MSFAYVDKEALKDKPKLWICKPNKQRIEKLTDIYGLNLATKENALNELSFTIPVEVERNHELVPNPLLKKLKGHYLVELHLDNNKEYFIITNDSGVLSNDGVEKQYTLLSYAHKLAKKFIRQYEGVSQNLTKYVADLLSETSWKIGSVDVEFDTKYRAFDVSSSSVLQCIFDIAEKFGAMVEFDTVNKRVSFYKSDRGLNRGLRLKEGFYLESFDVKYDYDTIVTRLKAYGYDGLEFRSLSPTSSNYIENFNWFMYPFEYSYDGTTDTYTVTSKSNYMSDNLCLALVKYNKLLDENKTTFNDLATQRTTKQSELATLELALVDLNNELKILQTDLDVINSTYGDSATSRQDYQTCITNINAKNTQITNKQNEIDAKKTEISDVDFQITALSNLLLIENNLTTDELLELDDFIFEEEYINDSITEEQDLLNEALSVLEELSPPTVTLSVGLANFLNSLENDVNRKKLILGDTIRFKSEKLNLELKARIAEINRDFESGNVSLTITNVREAKDEDTRIYKMIYGSASTSNSVNMDKFKWNQAVTQADDVSKLINNTFDATLHGIKGGLNSSITWNERGIFAQNINEPNKMLVIQGGQLALSNDSLQSVGVAVTPDGVFADKLIGRMILGNKLHIEDELGIVKIESGTATFFNETEQVTAQLGKYTLDGVDKVGLYIPNGSIDIRTSTDSLKGVQFDVNGIRGFNSNGVKTFEIDSATGIATLQNNFVVQSSTTSNRGFKIDENGIHGYNSSGVRTFHVDTNGYLTATSGIFSGTINGGQITSNTSIDVTTDVNVGQRLYVGIGQTNLRTIHFGNKGDAYLETAGFIRYHTELDLFEISSTGYFGNGSIKFNASQIDFNNANIINLKAVAVFG